ncbi:GAF and ANTAR domain-containing protein [Goekera deserti]|uniref:GAF and ANTAR domain-containing protein n=1 Tax=Goekera deserti TaxID=2497753 RepID=UPI001F47FF36|nr:GAF and ANTAR domain-containing protein [Goekera deserti]
MDELLRALAGLSLVDRHLDDVLTEITAVARDGLPGAEATSITLIRRGRAFTAAFAGELALSADELQYERGFGPCMDAGRAGLTLVVDDMRTEERWPDYARRVTDLGVLSSLSVPLPFQGETVGALNNYATRPEAFGEEARVLGEQVAAAVAVAVANADAVARAGDAAENMQAAMRSRAVIEQAKGILMERHRLTADAAFTVLTRASQRSNTKLRDVAEELARTGVLPGL